eukprot:261620-Hanusia_phi.AAC.1
MAFISGSPQIQPDPHARRCHSQSVLQRSVDDPSGRGPAALSECRPHGWTALSPSTGLRVPASGQSRRLGMRAPAASDASSSSTSTTRESVKNLPNLKTRLPEQRRAQPLVFN